MIRAMRCDRGTPALGPPGSSPDDESQPAPGTPPEWEARIRVFGWFGAFHGDVVSQSAKVVADAELDEAFQLHNFGAGAEIDVRWRRLVVLAGGSWFDVDDERKTSATSAVIPLFSSIQFGDADPIVTRSDVRLDFRPGHLDVDVEQVLADLQLGYRAWDGRLPAFLGGSEKDDRRVSLDLLAGVRRWDVHTSVEVRTPPASVQPFDVPVYVFDPFGGFHTESVPASPELAAWIRDTVVLRDVRGGHGAVLPEVAGAGTHITYRADEDWIDAVVGLRLGVDLTDWLHLRLRGDVGGFGIGDASRIAYAAEAALVFALARHFEAELSWYVLGVDRDHGSVALDTIQHGPRVGLVYRF